MSTRQDGVRRRTELLDAALHCFTTNGVLATGIEDIRRQAGASPSSVYHHFDGMTGIVVALLTRTFERLVDALADQVLRTRTGADAVRALVTAQLDWVAANPDEARVMYQAMTLELAGERSGELLAAKATLAKPVFDHIARFVEAGELPRWPRHSLELVILGPANDVSRRYLAGGDIDFAWMRASLPGLAVRMVVPRPTEP